ncbi:IS66 family transposase [Nannocystis radixulma]|uniref:Transposase n=1 Tax=Nannocystis radixulma TaxID=2995305 RepID=A0ABT5BP31_9BACT|nr:transposase [Nannocystis radixulma]MDC0675325.1 transposase [Nannocystis radixulma]
MNSVPGVRQRAHFWVLVAPERHVLYHFSHKHDSAAVDRLLAGYKGYLVADAHSVYDHLYGTGDVVEVACWAHARRYFFKALSADPERAERGEFSLTRRGERRRNLEFLVIVERVEEPRLIAIDPQSVEKCVVVDLEQQRSFAGW